MGVVIFELVACFAKGEKKKMGEVMCKRDLSWALLLVAVYF